MENATIETLTPVRTHYRYHVYAAPHPGSDRMRCLWGTSDYWSAGSLADAHAALTALFDLEDGQVLTVWAAAPRA